MKPHEIVEQEAARWISRADAPEWSAGDERALQAWLAQDALHRVTWLRLKSVWRRADRLAALQPRVSPRAMPRPLSRIWAMAAGVAAIALLAGLSWLDSDTGYSTGVGGRESVALADGSRLELNTMTRVRTQIESDRREVWLLRGEAYFDVKPDPDHPFVIHAGDHRVVVLGTRFSVRREQGRFEVAVQEGRVRVEPLDASPGKPPLIVHGGDILYGKPVGTVVANNAADRVRRALSWRHGTLEFDQSTLQDAAEQFNRYNRKQLVLMDADTARMRIGGSFDANGVEAFSRLLEQGFNLKVEARGDEIRVSQPR